MKTSKISNVYSVHQPVDILYTVSLKLHCLPETGLEPLTFILECHVIDTALRVLIVGRDSIRRLQLISHFPSHFYDDKGTFQSRHHPLLTNVTPVTLNTPIFDINTTVKTSAAVVVQLEDALASHECYGDEPRGLLGVLIKRKEELLLDRSISDDITLNIDQFSHFRLDEPSTLPGSDEKKFFCRN